MNPAALVTGGAMRIGRAISLALHGSGHDLVVHYHRSREAAETLVTACNRQRPDSAIAVQAELCGAAGRALLVERALAFRRRYAVLVHNAALFRPTPLAEIRERDWEAFIGLHLVAPLELTRGLAPALRGGAVINITDIYAHRPLAGHLLYCLSKAGLTMLTRALALELAPHVRVNAVAPGAILPPPAGAARLDAIRKNIPLGRIGDPGDVAAAVLYLAGTGAYLNGQTLTVDGGRLLPIHPHDTGD